MFEPPSEEQLSELRVKHGADMRVVEMEDMVFVLALPADDKKVALEFKRFTELYDADKRKEALAGVFHACVVYPEKEHLDRVLARRPGFPVSLGRHAAELLGVQVGAVKKY